VNGWCCEFSAAGRTRSGQISENIHSDEYKIDKTEKDETDAIKTVKKNARKGTKFEKTVFRHMKNYGNIQQKAFITSNVEKRWLMGAL
jgi:hypothetical protein